MSSPDDRQLRGTRASAADTPGLTSLQPCPTCPLCSAAGELHLDALEDRHFAAPGIWSHRVCPRCELVWLDPQPGPDDLERLYADYYTHEEAAGDSLLLRAIRRGIPAATQGYADRVRDPAERALGRLLAFIGPLRELAERNTMDLPASLRGELLDVGCGNGAFLAQMREFGWSVSGVERDPRGAEVARAKLGEDRVHADLEAAAALRPEGYDVVTLSHVIEHLLEPIETLAQCRALLRPGGRLVVATPNVASRGHRHFKRNWLHLDPPRHIHLYTPATLGTVVSRAGFGNVRVSTPSASAHFVWQASRELADRGRLPEIRVTQRTMLRVARSIGFWAYEYVLTRMGRLCGEELLLSAENPR